MAYEHYVPKYYGGCLFEKYENATMGALSAYILELSLKGYSDDSIAVALGVRWAYLFQGLRWEDWFKMVEQFRAIQREIMEGVRVLKKQGSASPAPAVPTAREDS